ncbi:choice-of-anchor P family protein [Streptomyces sp. LHD-70]|uniref:choice-of-anchor P family protein n=1 Tax=Streptomyces sp. LHD-70 TaxID=3072140 RepID=UPI00280FD6B4|nr:choice-of-anchor P family protein [Streptomyces sp. LHD-70]MDQ8702018.1 choice-of-anchor P family protein [Streptomyces sp. LHD-70]
MKRRIAMVLGGVLAAAALSAPTASADPLEERPDFKAPYQCDEKGWTYFSEHEYDGAIDINWGSGEADRGKPVLASADGTVHLGEGGGAGKYVELDHGGGWQTRYLHLDSQDVEEGAEVKQGQQIGTLGSTEATVAHLHFDQRLNDEGVDIHLEGKNLAPYPVQENRKELISSNCRDGGDPGDPEPEDTTLAYTGDKSIANGSEATLSAELRTEESDEPVKGREVSFELGSEDGGGAVQTCDGETDADGTASCTVEVADQKLTDDGTVPLTATFAGDDAYVKSTADADLKLQHVEGRSYGLAAEVPLPLLPLSIDPTPDTGTLRTAEAESLGPECAESVNAVVLNADALCAEVAAEVGPSAVTSTATVADASIGLPGLPVVGVSGLTAKSTSSCEASAGSVELELTVAGNPVEIPDTPGFEVDLGLAGKLVVNEQIPVEGADKGLTVNAVHLTTLAGADVVIGSSTSSAHDCA